MTIGRRSVDELRYAIFRRVAAALRHDVAGRLHPVVLMADVMRHQLAVAAPDIESLRRNADVLQTQLKSEAPALVRLSTWLEPRDDVAIGVGHGVAECVDLLAVDCGLRGVRLENRVGVIGASVPARGLNLVLAASLLAATDGAPRPCDLLVDAVLAQGRVAVTITPRDNHALVARDSMSSAAERPLVWEEVARLAVAEGVEFERHAGVLVLGIPVVA